MPNIIYSPIYSGTQINIKILDKNKVLPLQNQVNTINEKIGEVQLQNNVMWYEDTFSKAAIGASGADLSAMPEICNSLSNGVIISGESDISDGRNNILNGTYLQNSIEYFALKFDNTTVTIIENGSILPTIVDPLDLEVSPLFVVGNKAYGSSKVYLEFYVDRGDIEGPRFDMIASFSIDEEEQPTERFYADPSLFTTSAGYNFSYVDGKVPVSLQQQVDDITAVVGNVPSIDGGSSYSYLFDKDFTSSNAIALSSEELSLLLESIVIDDDQTIINSIYGGSPLGDLYTAKLLPDTINNLNIVYKDGVSTIPFIKDGVLGEESFEVDNVFTEGPATVYPALLVDHVVTEDGEKYLPVFCGYAPNIGGIYEGIAGYCLMLQVTFENIIIGGEF